MLGILAWLGLWGAGAAKTACEDHEMKKQTTTIDENGNVHYMDSRCRDYINGERVIKTEISGASGGSLFAVIGENSKKVYSASYGRGTQQLLEMSERNKERAIKNGRLSYMQFNPYFGRTVPTEVATGRTITCLFGGEYTDRSVYRKWYFRPECQGNGGYRSTVKGDYGIDITKEEYYKLKNGASGYSIIPSDPEVADELMGIKW